MKIRPLLRLKYLLVPLLFAMQLPVAQATHIVGGEIGYRCLGNNRYEITLRVYRDCYYGDVLAPFDDPASIGVYDRNNFLVRNLLVAKIGNDTLTNVIDKCILNSGNVCVHTTTYKTVVELTPREGGYRFVYQRCCRNQTVRNIVKPLETGATYDILLTEAAMRRCNSSPQFRAWPPIFICQGEPLNFDHSATDIDGDSLVYELCVPFQGGTFAFPQPIPPDSPPYDTVVWNNPPGQIIYSVPNMLGFGEPLRVNPVSGLMTAIPGQVGQYVVGVCIKEYDRQTKLLISETRRDFQYNVIECQRVTAAIFAPEAQCDNLTVTFRNQSLNATNFQWYLDWPATTPASTLKDPVFTYPDTGSYRVALIAEPNTLCADTAFHDLFLQYNSLKTEFQADVFDCFGGAVLQLRDLSKDTVSPVVKWEWEVLFNGQVIRDSVQNPTFIVPPGVKGTIRLRTTSKNGCVNTAERSFEAGNGNPGQFLMNTRIEACLGQTIGLNPNTPSNITFKYHWSPATGLSDTTAINPTLTVTGDATYSVTISPLNGLCDTVIQVSVVVIDAEPASFSTGFRCDGLTAQFRNTTQQATGSKWIIGDPANPIFESSAKDLAYTFSSAGQYAVTLIALSNCPDTVTQTITVPGPALNAGFAPVLVVCPGVPTQVNPTGNPFYQYEWSPATGLSATNIANPIVTVQGNTTYQVRISDQSGVCDTVVTVEVLVADFKAVAPPQTVVVCPGKATPLNPNGSNLYKYVWIPATGLSATNVPNPTVTTNQAITYTVKISDLTGQCDTTVTVQVKLVDFKSVAPAATVVVCPGKATPLNPNGSDLYQYSWSPATGLSAMNVPNPSVTTSQPLTYTVKISDLTGQCDTTVTVQVKMVDFRPVAPPQVVVVCPDKATPLNPNGSNLYQYTWSPATGLSATNVPNPTVTTNGPVTFTVVISDLTGQCDTTVTVQVKLVDFKAVAPPQTVVVCPGKATPLNPNGSNLYQYTWSPAAGLSATNVPNPTVTTNGPVTYTVVISDLTGQCDTTVTVQVKLVDFKSVAPPQMVVACSGIPTPLNPNGSDLYKYAWSPATGLSATNVPNPTATTNQDITYTVKISDLTGQCDTTVTVQVRMVDFSAEAPPPTLVVCPGAPTPLHPNANPLYRYEWSPATGLSAANVPNPTVTTSQPITYTVKISDPTGQCETTFTVQVKLVDFKAIAPPAMAVVCPGKATPLNPNGSSLYKYTWSPATGLSATNVPNPSVTTSQPITYTVVISDLTGQCDTTVTVQVKLVDFKAVAPPAVAVVCPGKATPLNPNGSDLYKYEWSPATGLSATNVPNPRVTTNEPVTYTVKISDLTGQCDTAVTVQVRMVDFSAEAPPPTLVVCPGAPTPLHPNANPLYRYEWSPATGLSAANVPNPTVTTSQPITYTVKISDPTGQCETTFTVQVKLVDFKAVAPPAMTVVCPGKATPLNPNGSDLYKYQWSPATGLSATNVPNPTVTTNEPVTYTVKISDLTGQCDTTVTVQVKLVDFKAVAPPAMAVVCPGKATQLNPNGSSLYKYTWSPATGLSAANVPNPAVTTTQPITYTVVISDLTGQCDTTVTVQVKVVDFKAVSPPATTIVCPGAATSLNPNGSDLYKYTWSPATGLSATNVPNPTVTTNEPVTYTVVISDLTGQCDTTVTVQVKLVDFKAVSPPAATVVCPGKATPLNPNGSNLYKYTWSPATGLSATNVPNPTVTTNEPVTYTVKISDLTGQCDTTVAVQVKLVDFKAVAPPSMAVVCPGKATPLNPNGSNLYQYSWSPATGLSATNVPNPSVTTSQPITYTVVISDLTGQCDTTVTVQVKVVDFKAVSPPAATVVCPGKATPLNPNGSNLYKYEWSPATGLSATNVPNPTVTTNEPVTYTVKIADLTGQCDTTVTVQVKLVDFKAVAPPSMAVVCPGKATPLNPNGSNLYKYSWSPATGLSATNVPNPTVTTNDPITYTVVISDLTGQCDTTVAVQVKLVDFKAVAPPQMVVVCPGKATPLNPNGSSLYKYTWSPATGLSATNVPNPTVTTTQPITYTVVISDLTGQCDTTVSVQVKMVDFRPVTPPAETLVCPNVPTPLNPNASSLYKYEWSPATGLSATDVANPSVTTDKDITFTVKISELSGQCDTTVTVQVKIVRFSLVAPDTQKVVCADIPTPLNPRGDARFRYEWTPATGLSATNTANPSVQTKQDITYQVKITAPDGRCDTTLTVRVQVAPPMNPDAGKDTTLCALGTYVLNGKGTGATRFEWSEQPNFGTLLGQGAQLNYNLSRGTRKVYLRTTDQFGCSAVDSLELKVFPVLASLPATVGACLPNDMIGVVLTNGDPQQVLRYRWRPASLIISDSTAGPSALFKAQDQARISVLATNQFGCSQEFSTTVTVLNLPAKLSISADKNPIDRGESAVLTVSGCTGCTYQWTPSVGLSNTNSASVTASPDTSTTYVVRVTKDSCVDTISIRLIVEFCAEPFVPNAFTPNGDRINDILYVRVQAYEELRFIIYNRWGQEVFDTRDAEIGWDGTFRGKELPPDVYGYYVYMRCPDGTEYKKRGNVSLIR